VLPFSAKKTKKYKKKFMFNNFTFNKSYLGFNITRSSSPCPKSFRSDRTAYLKTFILYKHSINTWYMYLLEGKALHLSEGKALYLSKERLCNCQKERLFTWQKERLCT
jgi:hypothetical protein